MARSLKPLIRGGGYYPSRKWTPLVYNGGYTTMNGGGEPPEPPTPVYWKTITGVSPLSLVNAIAHSIKSLTQYGKCEQRNLPQGYTEVQSVWNASSTYVRTGFKADVDDIVMEIRVIPKSGSWYMFQSRGSNIFGLAGTNSGNKINGGTGTSVTLISAISRETDHTYFVRFSMKNGEATLYVKDETSGDEDTQTDTYTFSAQEEDICLFGNTSPNYIAPQTVVYYARMWKSGSLVMDYIPATLDTTVGFYDKVSKSFKEATTGTLYAGSNATPTPDRPMDIWCNNGAVCFSPNLFDKSVADANSISAFFPYTGTTWTYVATGFSVRIPCSPNTTYTARYNGTSTQAVLSLGSTSNDDVPTPTSQTVTVTQAIRQSSPTINTPITLTTGANDKWLIVAYNLVEPQHSNMANNLQVEKGAVPTVYKAYHGGGIYADGTPETLTVSGKNLLNSQAFTLGKRLTDTGGETSESNGFVSAEIPVTAGTTYTYSQKTGNSILLRICEYDADGNLVMLNKYTSSGVQTQTFTTQLNTAYVRCSGDSRFVDTPPQLELGSTPTAYQQYSPPQTVNDVSNLLAVGDYADTEELVAGIKTGKVGIKVLDGTEAFINGTNGYITEAVQDQSGATYTPICTHFCGVSTTPTQNSETVRCYRTSGDVGRMYFAPNMTTYPTKGDFAAFLAAQYAAGTPVIVLYPLSTETTEQTTTHSLNSYAGTNVVDAQTNVDPVTLSTTYALSEE